MLNLGDLRVCVGDGGPRADQATPVRCLGHRCAGVPRTQVESIPDDDCALLPEALHLVPPSRGSNRWLPRVVNDDPAINGGAGNQHEASGPDPNVGYWRIVTRRHGDWRLRWLEPRDDQRIESWDHVVCVRRGGVERDDERRKPHRRPGLLVITKKREGISHRSNPAASVSEDLSIPSSLQPR